MAAGAASNPEKPPFCLDMPLAIVDGKAQIVPEVRDKIVAADPVHQLERYLAKPERLNAIMIFQGACDNVVPVDLARDFDQHLTDRAVEHEYLEVQGGHCQFGHRGYAPVLKFMSDNLAGEPAE